MPRIDDVRRYAVVDSDGDTKTLEMCVEAAVEWFKRAGVPEPDKQNALYEIGVCMLATHYYDMRSERVDQSTAIPRGVFTIAQSLRY
ncbi:MAG: head-tail connector protein [Clostridia bacterium]